MSHDELPTEDPDAAGHALWPTDTGHLGEGSRRALLQLIKGPYLSRSKAAQLWSALLADETAIRSRLHELFLELTIDRDNEVAHVRNADTGADLVAPSTVRAHTLTFMDTAMLLVLRQMLLAREGEGRVIVGQDEVYEQLHVYRTADRDEHDFGKRMNASWGTMKNKLRIIHSAPGGDGEDRVEISPVLRLIVDAEQVRAIAEEYRRIARGETAVTRPLDAPDADDDTDDDTDEATA